MKKTWVCLIGITLVVLLSGCGADTRTGTEKETEDAESAWNAFIGENNGKTGPVEAAPEVDENGNYIQSDIIVTKPKTGKVPVLELPPPPVSEGAPPRECLEKWLEGFSKSDWAQVKYLSAGFDWLAFTDDESSSADYIIAKMKYSVKKGTEENGVAKFNVEISRPDVKEALRTYIHAGEIDADSTDVRTQVDEDVKAIADKAQFIKENIEVTLTEEESVWKVNVTDDLLDTVSCGLSEIYRELSQEYMNEVSAQ